MGTEPAKISHQDREARQAEHDVLDPNLASLAPWSEILLIPLFLGLERDPWCHTAASCANGGTFTK
jgi:hypothetical protein